MTTRQAPNGLVYLILLSPLLAALGGGLVQVRGANIRALLASFLFGPMTLLGLVSPFVNVFTPRYMVVSLPAYVTVVGATLRGTLGRRLSGRIFPLCLTCALASSLGIHALSGMIAYFRAPTWDGYDWRGAMAYIRREVSEKDAIVLLPSVLNVPYQAYRRTAGIVIPVDPARYIASPQPTEWLLLEEALRSSLQRGDVWVITVEGVFPTVLAGIVGILSGESSLISQRAFGSVNVFRFRRTPDNELSEIAICLAPPSNEFDMLRSSLHEICGRLREWRISLRPRKVTLDARVGVGAR